MSPVIERVRRLFPFPHERRADLAGQVLNQILQKLPQLDKEILRIHLEKARKTYQSFSQQLRFTRDQPDYLDEAIVTLQLAKTLAIKATSRLNWRATDRAYFIARIEDNTVAEIKELTASLDQSVGQGPKPVKDVQEYLQATASLAQEILFLTWRSQRGETSGTTNTIRLQLALPFNRMLQARAGE